jgi:hypothetical protein
MVYALTSDASELEMVRGISQAFADGDDDVYLSGEWWGSAVQQFRVNLRAARAANKKGDELMTAVWDPIEEDFRRAHASLLPPAVNQLQVHLQSLKPGTDPLCWLYRVQRLAKVLKLPPANVLSLVLDRLSVSGYDALFIFWSTYASKHPADGSVEGLLAELKKSPHVLRAAASTSLPVTAAAVASVTQQPSVRDMSALVSIVNSMAQLNASIDRLLACISSTSLHDDQF